MNKHLIIGVVILLLAVGLSGCNEPTTDKRFVGTWTTTSDTDTFFIHPFTCFSDGTFTAGKVGSLASGSGNWEIKDGKFVLSISTSGLTISFDFSFSNNDNTLTLTSSGTSISTEYTKQ